MPRSGSNRPAGGSLGVAILAAGQGTRMRSSLPKVLHDAGGQPLLAHVLQLTRQLAAETVCVVIGHGGDQVRIRMADHGCLFAVQKQQLGTAHALAAALPVMPATDRLLVLYGDVPLLTLDTVQRLLDVPEPLAVLTAVLEDATGYGRIVRDEGTGLIQAIVEQKDCQPTQAVLREVNTGVMVFDRGLLDRLLPQVRCDNAQGEYYLTDLVALARREGLPVAGVAAPVTEEILGVNDPAQLATVERVLQRRRARALMTAGVRLRDPERFDLRGCLQCGQDVEIDINVLFEGEVRLGDRVRVAPGCVLRDCSIGNDTRVEAHSVIDGARIGAGCRVGPFARLRPGTELADRVHVGNFVEVKNSQLGEGSKANHLAYVGDTSMGRACNVGAGTITCNYDGAHKHRTDIGDEVFIGSDTQLVAPVRIGNGATIGAGSTITRDVPDAVLAISRVPQKLVSGWKRPRKDKD